MILKILLFVVLFLLLLFLFYPLRLLIDASYSDGKGRWKLKICPVFTIRRFAFTVLDTEAPKKEAEPKPEKKRKKTKEKELKKERTAEREMKPLHELILSIVDLIGRAKKGVKRLRVTLYVAYGFPDPAVTGEITGAFYAALPPFFGDMRRSHWKIGLYPQWCLASAVAAVKGDICFNVFQCMIAFGGMIPEILKILPKKKKSMNVEVKYEPTSH